MIEEYTGPLIWGEHGKLGEVYDYSKLDTFEEFQQLTASASIILAFERDVERYPVVPYGNKLLLAIKSGMIPPQECEVVAFAIDLSSESAEVEHLCAAITAAKGCHEWPALRAT